MKIGEIIKPALDAYFFRAQTAFRQKTAGMPYTQLDQETGIGLAALYRGFEKANTFY